MNFPSWFPSGDKNVYETEDENDSSAIWVLNLDSNGEPSGEPQEIVKNYFTPAWSPDGNSIIVSDRDNLLLMSPSDGRIIKKFSTGIPKNAYPCYSDDGEKIVFCSYVNEDEVNIYIMNSDGSNVKRITSGKYDCNPSIY